MDRLIDNQWQEQARKAVSLNGYKALAHAKARRLGWLPVELVITR